MTMPLIAPHSRNPLPHKKRWEPVLETIFRREHRPDHRCCLRQWPSRHTEIIDVKMLWRSMRHSINVSPYYFLLFILLHKGLNSAYHALFTTHSRGFVSLEQLPKCLFSCT